MTTKYVNVGKRKVPFFSRDEIHARGQVPLEQLVIGEVYWHFPGDALFVVRRFSSAVIEGEIDLGHWRDWMIDMPMETGLYPVSDVELALMKDTIERSKWWVEKPEEK